MGKFDSKVFEVIFLGYSLERTAYKVYVLEQKKIIESTYVTFDDDNCPGLKCLDDNEAEALKFENLNINSDSEDEAEVYTSNRMDEESTKQVNHESGCSSQPPEFDSTNSGGERGESSASHANVVPKKTEEALLDPDWLSAMQEVLNQFERNKVSKLVPVPKNRSVIGTKWVFGNKMDENGTVTRKKIRGTIDKTLFYKKNGGDMILVQIYVDDIIFGSTNERLCQRFSKLMQSEYIMSMMGELSYFLGFQMLVEEVMELVELDVLRNALVGLKGVNGLSNKQRKRLTIPVDPTSGLDARAAIIVMRTVRNTVDTGRTVVFTGRVDSESSVLMQEQQRILKPLIDVSADIRTERELVVLEGSGFICSTICKATVAEGIEVISLSRYLKGTPNLGLWYLKGTGFEAVEYTDADFVGCRVERKSTSGSCQFLEKRLVSWYSKKQQSVSTSTVEAEYIATGSCCAKVLWIRNQLMDYGPVLHKILIMCDITSAISIVANPVNHPRRKHIDVRYHFIREYATNGTIELIFVPIEK
ncbi:hypothetical protein AgCh_025431 [Apium graveolens]